MCLVNLQNNQTQDLRQAPCLAKIADGVHGTRLSPKRVKSGCALRTSLSRVLCPNMVSFRGGNGLWHCGQSASYRPLRGQKSANRPQRHSPAQIGA